ncbi:OmpH family outer membrane protein [Arundinibacter roseus]|uniref:OmpH family outer membrane protein n=1 Tax=Arundinibacter roseus TaxID=2070510 RepID=A0A4R4JTT6_9BACT|nr:OmpH family outer membrane protein [Arundinibacter roseus]TDB58107.1 OmpH family outer membrane protein [Arundinibacter roseus]
MNNNTSLIWNIVLTLAVIVLYFLHFSGSNTGAAGTASDATGGRRIVYVQVDSLLRNYDYFEETQKELENKRFQLENELTNRGRSLENEIQFFQQKAQTMTLDQARATEAQLGKKQQDLIAYRDRSAQTLAQQEADKNSELYDLIYQYIEKYNKSNQYEYVLGYSKGGGILFADSTLNVTQKMIEGLNKEYKAKSGSATAAKDSADKK